jgi:anti-sigma regulatory factor (Ser/Thr protein kinase)
MTESRLVTVGDLSGAAAGRRAAVAVATALGLDEATTARAALVATEMGTNLVKHAGGGEMLVGAFDDPEGQGLELLALDKGPGMVSVAECRRDGFSTSGSPGTGLGAIGRLSDLHEIYSRPGQGTALMARLCCPDRPSRPSALAVGGIVVARRGETTSGDGWAMRPRVRGSTLLVSDGLGHGPLAAAATSQAIRTFHDGRPDGPGPTLRTVHEALRATRGAAVAVCDVDGDRDVVTFAGIGNITGIIASDGTARHLVSHNGIVGQQMRTVQEFTYPWPPRGTLVLHSDGLTAHWRLDGYPGLEARHPSLVAGVLYRDFSRGRDDVVVVVARRRDP